jgi:hypothetical protein
MDERHVGLVFDENGIVTAITPSKFGRQERELPRPVTSVNPQAHPMDRDILAVAGLDPRGE